MTNEEIEEAKTRFTAATGHDATEASEEFEDFLRLETKKFYVLWNIDPRPEGVEFRNIPEGWGASQSCIVISCAEHDDGSYSQRFFDAAKDGKPMHPYTLFKIWLVMGQQLLKNYDLGLLRSTTIMMAMDFFMGVVSREDRNEEE